MTNDLMGKQAKLFRSFQFLRLTKAREFVFRDLNNNVQVQSKPTDGFFSKLVTGIGNEFRNERTRKFTEKEKAIDEATQKFVSDHCGPQGELYSLKEIPDVIKELFSDDVYEIEKAMFSISIIFDEEYKYEYPDETLRFVSSIIWNDENTLTGYKKDIMSTYKELAKQPLSMGQKLFLGGTATLVLLFPAIPSLAISGLSASGITSTLAGFGLLGLGGTMVEGVGLMALAELLLDGALIGFTYAALDSHNKTIVKKSFRDMNFNDAALMLAIKCRIMSLAKDKMPKEIFKEKSSELLQMIQDLKSDTDYVLLVEKQNIEENKKKIRVFHNLDDELVKAL